LLDRVYPLDRNRVASTIGGAIDRGSTYETEFRLIADDEVERWVLAKGEAFGNGKALRVLGVFVDVTERHRAEQQLRELGGRLLKVHEQERRRLSRELHDGVGQRIALVSAELGMLRNELTSVSLVRDRIQGLLECVGEVGCELHRVSYELHPVWLDHLGLSASIRRLCAELSAAHRIAIHLELGEMPAVLMTDIALCMYRIAQEALHNMVTVRLGADAGDLSLSIVDDGVGFNPVVDHAVNGVGLVSMRERARHVEGHLTLTSQPGHGTRVDVRVPLRNLVAS
jgi:signal transduction histidine kinase